MGAAPRVYLLFVVVVVSAIIFHRLSESSLAGDDCYYSEISKEMARTGDYWTPRNGYVVDFHTSKPPMLFWMNALSGNLFGFTTFAMRLPSAILAFLGVLALLFFVARYFNRHAAFVAALVLAFTQQYLYHARSAVTDGPFAAFFAFSLFSFWIARAENKPVFFYLAGFFAGLAVMTRQLPGFFIFAVIGAYIIFAREFVILKNPHVYAGFLLSAAILLPWHILMYAKYGDAFLRQYFGVALMTAFKGYPSSYSANPSLNPWYAYFSILWSNYWPWFPFLVTGFAQLLRKCRSSAGEERKKVLFILLWSSVPFLLFQMARVKQYHYLVPLYVPFAIITALAFNNLELRVRQRTTKALAGAVTLMTLVCLLYPVIPRTLDSREYSDTITMVPEVKKIRNELITLHDGFCHYNNCLQFYADKKVVPNTEEEIAAKIAAGRDCSFILAKADFGRIARVVHGEKIDIIMVSRDSVLFSTDGPKKRS